MMQVVQGSEKVANERDRVKLLLERIKEVAECEPTMDLGAILSMADGPEKEVLEAALDLEKLMELLPEEELKEVNALSRDGLHRLRKEGNGHWAQVITGWIENEMEEIYTYLRLVQIPKMAVKILLSMSARSKLEVMGLESEQRTDYRALRKLATEVVRVTELELGEVQTATKLKISLADLWTCLKDSLE